ncbi:peptidoglycan D,D-transpeptidase FtsI family protein [Teredinibacter waterburyi]|jgi:peptidoglycan synthetase FtsI (EC 2.4.1.129)|uniref:peptidoglycan D,D-transpeptidase FtsI family protein n=1 Tax=Teredinibacter waterburyi TaxID=1500538 RepID=UPI00165F8474|nr:penicillin-binding protein 2 [Teredinibacter waterburyi]
MKLVSQLANWRFWIMGGLLCTLPISLIWHLANLQVMPNNDRGFEFLQSEGEARTLRSELLQGYRGVITDRNGELLAVSTPVKTVYANPQLLDPAQHDQLAAALDMTSAKLRERIRLYANKQFVYLARHLPPHEADKILSQGFKGVSAEIEYRRFYPAGEVTAHVVGFTDINDEGQEGVELAFEKYLAGTVGYKRVLKDLKGNIVREDGILKAPMSGSDLSLSIDLRLQYLAYRELKSAVAKQGAKSGSVVIMDVDSGEILAMVNQPSYNPNDRAVIDVNQLRNRALTDVFEPGSTMKPFTVMAALETGKYDADYTINTSPGYVMVGKKALLDPVDYGVMSLTKIITKSSQVGITKLALDLGVDPIRDLFYRVGLGQGTGIGFPGESIGSLPSRNRWHPIEVANLAFGYGLNVNAVQLAQAYTLIASGGEFKNASLIKNQQSASFDRVVDESIAKTITDMLKTVPQKGGTATRAQVEAYPVAGKTGTAHKVGSEGYVQDKHTALFAGFAPANNPRLVAVVIINEPSDGHYYGGEAAAPVFAQIIDGALKVLRVPPKRNVALAANVITRGVQ